MHAQKGNLSPVLILVTLLLALGFLAYLLISRPNSFNTKSAINSSPEVNQKKFDQSLHDEKEELENFPIYPESLFVSKEVPTPCSEEEKQTSLKCDAIYYRWQTNDNFDEVWQWFSQDHGSGWKCSGGAGSYNGPTESSTTTSCSNGIIKRALFIQSDKIKTEITLTVPIEEYKGKYF